MTSVTTSIEIDASVASVWKSIVDVSMYPDWHTLFPERLDTEHMLRSGDRLTADLPAADGPVPVGALVLEVRRHRTVTWMLLPAAAARTYSTGPEQCLDLAYAGLYRVDVQAMRPGRTVVVQHLKLGYAVSTEHVDSRAMARLLDAVQEGLRQRVEAADAAMGEHQITGTIRVTSRFGPLRHGDQPRSGLLTALADWAARWPRRAAA